MLLMNQAVMLCLTLYLKTSSGNPDHSQVKEIASYLEGYPPSIYNAVKACSLEGVDLVCSDKRALLDFQERIFKDF